MSTKNDSDIGSSIEEIRNTMNEHQQSFQRYSRSDDPSLENRIFHRIEALDTTIRETEAWNEVVASVLAECGLESVTEYLVKLLMKNPLEPRARRLMKGSTKLTDQLLAALAKAANRGALLHVAEGADGKDSGCRQKLSSGELCGKKVQVGTNYCPDHQTTYEPKGVPVNTDINRCQFEISPPILCGNPVVVDTEYCCEHSSTFEQEQVEIDTSTKECQFEIPPTVLCGKPVVVDTVYCCEHSSTPKQEQVGNNASNKNVPPSTTPSPSSTAVKKRCKEKTKKGKQCKNTFEGKGKYCHIHK